MSIQKQLLWARLTVSVTFVLLIQLFMVTSSYEQRCGFSMQFSFQYFFLFYGCYLRFFNCTIDFQMILIDFAIDFSIFAIWLLTYVWMDGQTDG